MHWMPKPPLATISEQQGRLWALPEHGLDVRLRALAPQDILQVTPQRKPALQADGSWVSEVPKP